MGVTNPGDIVDAIRSTWPEFELSDAQERLYAEYLKDIDPGVLGGALVALAADWDHPAPPGVISAAARERAKRTTRTKTWIRVGLATGIVVAVLGGILGIAAILAGGGTSTSNAATGAITQPGTGPQGQTAYLTTCTGATVRTPSTFTMACADSHYSLVGLQWQNWGAARAVATGAASMNNCSPGCADGQTLDYRVQVTASDPIARPSGPEYERLSVNYLHASPSGISNPDVWRIGLRGPRSGSASAQTSAQGAASSVAHRAARARPCSSYYDAKLGGTARIAFGAPGSRGGPYVKTPPDPTGINCTNARRIIRDLEAGKGTPVHGRSAHGSYTVVDGWKCATSTEATSCSKGNLSFIAGTGL
jgi:hypothetical protein